MHESERASERVSDLSGNGGGAAEKSGGLRVELLKMVLPRLFDFV